MALTGWSDRPALGPPSPLVPRLDEIAATVAQRSAERGTRVGVDPLSLLAERAAIAGLHRNGRLSCGGATRLLSAADGWIALSLARPDDVELLPAWLELEGPIGGDPWDIVTDEVAPRPGVELEARGGLLGLPLAALPLEPPASPTAPEPLTPLPCRADRLGDGAPAGLLGRLVVLDLSALWAGPLCGSLLARAGARVIKVESTARPDGARRGPAAFFDLLNASKESVAIDVRSSAGLASLSALVGAADVVVESSRPRALCQLGIEAAEVVRSGGPRIWVSITGHGRTGAGRDRVGFGDDAAAAGGLVAWDEGEPVFCADAVADPAAGLVAAAACLDALAHGGRWLIDVALAGVAAHLAGPTLRVPAPITPAQPVAPQAQPSAPALGADTDAVLEELEHR
jgi:hypothetical protein